MGVIAEIMSNSDHQSPPHQQNIDLAVQVRRPAGSPRPKRFTAKF